ncbi:MAG: tetratricopeptide repeat protein [Myxococcota bacterium]
MTVSAALAVMLWSGLAGAHPGLSKDVDRVTARLKDAPGDVELRVRRADLYLRLGHAHDALADLRVALRKDPKHERALLTRALVRVEQGRSQKALADLDKVLADGEGSSDAWVARARIHADAKRHDAARSDYDAAIARRTNPDFFLERGRVDEAREDWTAAAEGYREGVTATRGAIVLRLALLAAERQRGELEAAVAEADALLDAAPARVDWILLRAELYDETGEAPLATSERLRALALAHAAVALRPTELARRALQATYRALETTEPFE